MRVLCLISFILVFGFSEAQNKSFLRINYGHRATKSIKINNGDVIEYKVNGSRHYQRNRLVSLKDSTLVFENETQIKLADLKAIRFTRSNHLLGTFQYLFLAGGIGFFSLNSLNNLIIDTRPVFSPSAALISAALLSTGLIIKVARVKRIHITKKTVLKILEINFEELNNKESKP